jgi:hypothetical protein
MPNPNPSPKEIVQAFQKHGVDFKLYKNWDRGRAWSGPDGSKGLLGAVVHHTSTATATGSKGCPSLEWASAPFPGDPLPACNAIVGRGPGDTYILAAGSAYHCGDGGPFPGIGVSSRGFSGQFRLWGIEIDDPGTSTKSLTDYQIDNTAKMLAALAELCGWKSDMSTVITHKCWTDGCHGVNPNGPSPCLGRKNDTLDGDWQAFPGDPKPKPYNAPWWRERAKGSLVPPMWDGTVPSRAAVEKSRTDDAANTASWRLACKLYDIGMWADEGAKPKKKGVQPYPAKSVAKYRGSLGFDGGDSFSEKVQKKLFGTDKP